MLDNEQKGILTRLNAELDRSNQLAKELPECLKTYNVGTIKLVKDSFISEVSVL